MFKAVMPEYHSFMQCVHQDQIYEAKFKKEKYWNA